MGAQNFNFATTFSENGCFQPQILYYWTKIFRQLKILGEGKLPSLQQLYCK